MSSSLGSTSGASELFREASTPISLHVTDPCSLSTHQPLIINSHPNGPARSSASDHSTPDRSNASPIEIDCNPMYQNERLDLPGYHSTCFSEDAHLPQSMSHELSVNTGALLNESIAFSTPFHIKQESGAHTPPVRSLSAHSLPVSLAPSFRSITPCEPSLSDSKGEFVVGSFSSDSVDRSAYSTTCGSSILQPLTYMAYSCQDPNRTGILHSSLPTQFRSEAFHLPVFGDQSVSFPASSVNSQGQTNVSHHPSVNTSTNSHTNILPHPLSGPFELNEQHNHLSSLPVFATGGLIKRANPNGNGLCDNFVPLMDLSSSASGISLGMSPRSKGRRYSYPYEQSSAADEISKQSLTKDYPISSGDRSDREAPSPICFRTLTSSLPLTNLSAIASNGTRVSVCHSVDESHPVHKLSSSTDGEIPLPGFNSPESAFYQYQHRMEGQRCQVCGELAAGFHHGAYVCEACKKFFMRHSLTDTKPTNVCPTGGNCVVAKGSRGKCQICRYRKCVYVGMRMKDPETQPDIDISHIPCRVCGGRSSGFHFGALTCEGCKGFFRRTEGSAGSLVCVGGQNACTITPRSRNACKCCRFRRCLAAGMSKKGSRIGRQPNAVKFHCAIEIRQLRSLRASYSGSLDNPCGPMSSSSNMYGGFGGSDGTGLMMGTPGSLHNRSDAESPDNLTPTYNSKRENDTSNVWINEQKPPLSLLLLLPRSSQDPQDVSANCGGQYVSAEGTIQPAHHYSPGYSLSAGGMTFRNRSDSDVTVVDSATSVASRVALDVGDPQIESTPRSVSDGDDDDTNQAENRLLTHPLSCRTNLGNLNSGCRVSAVSSTGAVQSLSSPYSSSALDDHNGMESDELTSVENGQPSLLTTSLIANLAKRLSEEEQAGLIADAEDWVTATPPSQEAILRFTEGMRTATEFLRLPNTYFKTRFRMTSIPINTRDNAVQVWNHMMNHFHMHAQQIVQFAKLVPGFNQLGITARSSLVRGAMYPVMLLLLSRDYQVETDEYNYFDFTLDERNIIMHHFPTFHRITEHLRMTGRLLHHLSLSQPELSLSSAVEILRNYHSLEEPTLSTTKELFVLANHSLRACMTKHSDMSSDASLDERRRWAQLVALSKMIQAMNREHHEILASLKDARFDLHFPELYVEMFQLADSASALFSASAQAVTLACSGAFQSLAPLKLSLGGPLQGTGTTHAPSGELTDPAGFLPTGDRWDASRLALAVPAAMAAMAAVATSQQSPHFSTASQLRTAMEPNVSMIPNSLAHFSSSSVPQQEISPPPPPHTFLFPNRHPSS